MPSSMAGAFTQPQSERTAITRLSPHHRAHDDPPQPTDVSAGRPPRTVIQAVRAYQLDQQMCPTQPANATLRSNIRLNRSGVSRGLRPVAQAAAFKISFARRNSAFSRRRRFSSADSSEVVPGR